MVSQIIYVVLMPVAIRCCVDGTPRNALRIGEFYEFVFVCECFFVYFFFLFSLFSFVLYIYGFEAATLQRHHPHLHHQIPHLHQPQLLSPHSPSMAAAHQIDVYSQLGMQRLGQMYKAANVIQNNNNNNNNTNNNNHSSSNGSSAVSSTGQSQAKAIADATNKESNANNVQQLVESAIG